jgi:hypothetical protein
MTESRSNGATEQWSNGELGVLEYCGIGVVEG